VVTRRCHRPPYHRHVLTPPLPADVLARHRGLEAFARTATRLHPCPATVTVHDSHIGGPLLWPADEPWPTCERPHLVQQETPLPPELLDRLRAAEARRTRSHVMADGEAAILDEIAALVGPGYTGFGSVGDGPVVGHRFAAEPHTRPNPLVAVAQLRAADIPDLPTPDGTDLLQVLWCPFDHDSDQWDPTPVLRWRRAADVTDVLAAAPIGEIDNDEYVPQPCAVRPEQIVEYPHPGDVLDDVEDVTDDDFSAPGWKVGGYATWNVTDLLPTACPVCGGPTDLLLTAASSERGSGDRWRPVDDEVSAEPTGVIVGQAGALRVFACPTCPGPPFHLDLQ
jgi:hypothetical protein